MISAPRPAVTVVRNASNQPNSGDSAGEVQNGDRYVFLVDDNRCAPTQNVANNKDVVPARMKSDESSVFLPKIQEAVSQSRDQEEDGGKV